jgi:hypothetical protein
LQAMRNASPTGGALGQVSDAENKLLASTVANLDANQSESQLRDNLAQVQKHLTRVKQLIQQGGGGQGMTVAPPSAAVQYLKANPQYRSQFDEAASVLGQ